jgi:hypothetical protein
VKIASVNSFASENIMRQAATTESLKKIDELEEAQLRAVRKVEKQKAFAKVFDNYIKKTVHGGKQH